VYIKRSRQVVTKKSTVLGYKNGNKFESFRTLFVGCQRPTIRSKIRPNKFGVLGRADTNRVTPSDDIGTRKMISSFVYLYKSNQLVLYLLGTKGLSTFLLTLPFFLSLSNFFSLLLRDLLLGSL
jgi:hypothetical protein